MESSPLLNKGLSTKGRKKVLSTVHCVSIKIKFDMTNGISINSEGSVQCPILRYYGNSGYMQTNTKCLFGRVCDEPFGEKCEPMIIIMCCCLHLFICFFNKV